MEEWRKYLEVNIINDSSAVTETSFSIDSKLSIQDAQSYLNAFYEENNQLYPVYIIHGVPKDLSSLVDLDSESDSLLPGSLSQYALATKNSLPDICKQFEEGYKTQIYALSANPIVDFDELLPIIYKLRGKDVIYQKEDCEKYGFIHNENSTPRQLKTKGAPSTTKAPPSIKKEPAGVNPQKSRTNTSNLFRNVKPPSSRPASTANKTMEAPETKNIPESVSTGKPKLQTHQLEKENDDLKNIMEMDDDHDTINTPKESANSVAASPEGATSFDTESNKPSTESVTPEPQENITSISNGRKRGKRKVTRKVTTHDDEGFLITKEEQAWESFSEDENEKPKKVAPPRPKASNPPSRKKSGPQQAANRQQKSIMSFFGKK
ncbi:DNA polymerase delta subunit Cdc27 [Schizosaccharomyces cryophilus OY26]|uniref:DNA polymerase delta subunit 3 n=1 Tax=Schizosaccharomyces cryophilus (strain OY26 / ATCC MYA-4695 / CBS 11777 / NBRC 106824 / NRRL Y48691) TaxID=653667 RepID=S9VTN6_SCHCR|nr:DNA polymerase delta subunit Cdc27 [Schizosaccharomyces cryophilus OY26]EPY49410.1 DNA polymerase delta subunit Cdc27 [Schizosaccharomyces cryophilus OY26]